MNIIYSFYDRSYGYTRAIVAAIIGLVMVIWPDVTVNAMIIIIGLLLMLSGIISIILARTGKWKVDRVSLVSLNGLVTAAMGLVLVIFRGHVAEFIFFVFAIILFLLGVGEIISLIYARKKIKLSWGYYIGPLLTAIFGVVIMFKPSETVRLMFILFGVALLVYALSEFASTFRFRQLLKRSLLDQTPPLTQNEEGTE